MLFICNGMTRSGSTLQYNLVRGIVEHHGVGEAHGFFQDTPDDLDRIDRGWLTDDRVHVIKMHAYWQPDFRWRPGHPIKRCHVFRDLRDVAASSYLKFPVSFEELLGILDEAIDTDAKIRRDTNVLVQRYEDLVDDSVQCCQALANFMELPTPGDQLEHITKRCLREIESVVSQFPEDLKNKHEESYRQVRTVKRLLQAMPSSLKAFLKKFGLRRVSDKLATVNSQMDAHTLIHPDHFSPTRGKPGAWRNCFTQLEQQTLSHRYANWLADNQYENQ